MKRFVLKTMIFLVLLGQSVHALGLCSYHFHENDGQLGFQPSHCFCAHESPDRFHETCDHVRASQQEHKRPCESCVCSSNHPVPLPTRVASLTIDFDHFFLPAIGENVVPSERFADVPVNEKLPIAIPLYLSHCTFLI